MSRLLVGWDGVFSVAFAVELGRAGAAAAVVVAVTVIYCLTLYVSMLL